MVPWGLRWLRLFVNPYKSDEFEHISASAPETSSLDLDSDRRIYILGRLETSKFAEWSWIVIVAGVGFFTDAYAIFAINMVVPMLGIIYYGGQIPHSYDTALSVVTLGGSLIGQVGFGFAADIWGRRKMYGLELIITIGSTLGVVMSSNGTEGSMSVIVWLLVWRFVMGIGIGADYPLSAVICAEFSPTRLRGKMMTLVFLCQPLGQLAATLVALIAVVNQRGGIPADATVDSCDAGCKKTLDSIWRWIIGVGVIPAVIALWFRLTIIESPRYTADVSGDSRKAAAELQRYLPVEGTSIASSSSSIDMTMENNPLNRRTTNFRSSEDGATLQYPSSLPSNRAEEMDDDLEDAASEPEGMKAPPEPSWKDFKNYFWHNGNIRTLVATSLCWFFVDLPFYGLGMNSPAIIESIWYGANGSPPAAIYPLLIHDVWQSLVVVSIGAISGCLITFVAIDKIGRRNIQMIGFFWLFVLFIIIGGTFHHLYESGGSAAVIVLYILCQIFFNFGPNTTTYILPAELFPTRYRGLCHGISAAFGKLGSVVAQLFLAYINYGNGANYTKIQRWLPYSLLIFSFFMLCGLLITVFWLPAQERNSFGNVKSLEEWEVGRGSNTFAKTKFALAFASVYHRIAKTWDNVYLWLDKISGGDEAERRMEAREEEQEMEEVSDQNHERDV